MDVIEMIYIITAVCRWRELDSEIRYGLIKELMKIEVD